MNNNKETLTIKFEGETLKLRNGFVGGYLADETNCPLGMYAGKLDIGDMGVALLATLRACIKMNVEEQGMNLGQAREFISFTLGRAIEIERENRAEENVSLDQHKEVIIKMRRDF